MLQPHRKRDFLTPPPADPAELAEQICTVCEVYEATPALAAQGTHVMSTDEMTGIQAAFAVASWLADAARSGRAPGIRIRAAWHECRLIANLEVATGRVVMPSLGPTRTEADFAAHIAQTIQTDPEAAWIFITDQREHPSIGDLGASGGGTVWPPGGLGRELAKAAIRPS